MSAPSPWDRSPLDEPEVDPASRRRRAVVAAVVVAGSLVLATIVYLAGGRSGGTNPALTPVGPSGTTATSTTTTAAPSAPSSGPAPAPSTPTAVAPIHVDVVVGMVVIAGHMACTHEDELTGETVADVEAAVAADNSAKPYAHDAAAQAEIVRASVQQLHGTHRFYADCRPVTVSAAGSQTASTDGTGGTTGAGGGTPPASQTPSLPPSR